MSFAKDSLSVFSTRVLLLLLRIGGGIIIARVLGPTDNGILNIVVLIPNILVSVGHLGIGNANLYFIGKKKFSFQSILSNSLTLSITLGSFLILVYLVTVVFLRDTIFKEINLIFIAIAVLTIPLTLFIKYATYIFLGKQMIRERNLVNILDGLLSLICIIVFVLIFRLGIKGALISTLGGLLFATFYSLHHLRWMGRFTLLFNYELFKASVGYGIKTYLALIILSMNYRFDIFLVKYFLTNTDVGYYSLAVSIANKLWYLPSAVGIITYAKVASLDSEQANELTPKACRNTLLGSFIGGIVLFWAGRFLIPLVYGQAYVPSVGAFTVLLPGIVAMAIFMTLHSDLAGRGRPEITLYVFSGGLLVNIALNLFLIPKMGIEGAALASTVSYTVGSVVLAFIFSRLTNTRLRDLLLLQRNDIQDYRKMFARVKSRILD